MKYIPIVLLCLLCQCRSARRDHKLMEPDCCGGGYILTPLGRLVFGPWASDPFFDRYNQAVYLDGKEISSAGVGYSSLQKDLVFELEQDGSVQFWFRHDYTAPLAKRLSPDTSGILIKSNESPAEGQIAKIYKTGTWTVNFKDSTLLIDFGKEAGIPALKGRYKSLGSDEFDIQEISYFDSTYLGRTQTLTRINTTHYTHPWVHKLLEPTHVPMATRLPPKLPQMVIIMFIG